MKKIKVLLAMFLIVILAVSSFSVYASDEYYKVEGYESIDVLHDVINDGEWFYRLNDDDKTATIYAYSGKDINAKMPEIITLIDEEYKVTTLCLINNWITHSGLDTHFPVFNCDIKTLTLPKTFERFTVSQWDADYGEREDYAIKYKGKEILQYSFQAGYYEELESIIVDPKNSYFSSEDGVLFNKDKTVLIGYPANKSAKKYVIPKTVKKIAAGAFSLNRNSALKEIVIPEELKEIGIDNNIYGATITVYEDSPAHKYYKKDGYQEFLNVIDNPSKEKIDSTTPKKEAVKDDSAKTESVISKPVESTVSETVSSEEILTIGASESQTKPEKANNAWVIVAVIAVVLLASGGAAYWFIRKKKKV